jgi:hypothetical protein
MKDIIYYFGYAKIAEDPDNITGFYDYPKTDPDMLKKYYGFKELNEQSIGWNAYMNDEERALIQFMCSDPEKSAEVISYAESNKISECTMHDAELRMFGKARKVIP